MTEEDKQKDNENCAVHALNLYAKGVAWQVWRANEYSDSSEALIECIGSICLARWQIMHFLKDTLDMLVLVPAVNMIAHRALVKLHELAEYNDDVAVIIDKMLSETEKDYLEEFTVKAK